MIAFARRNIRLFFKDKAAVFFSLLAVFIIIGLYALFLGDMYNTALDELEGAKILMARWLMGGLLAVTSATTTMGAFGTYIEDQTKGISKDFYSAPLKRSGISGGYVIAAYFIGVIMSIVALIVLEIYILTLGGSLLAPFVYVKALLLILLSCTMTTGIIMFLVSFFKTSSAFGGASTLIGTLIGFLTGIYIPLGQLPTSVQYIIKLFPVSYSALLFRQTFMEDQIAKSFAGVPKEHANDFRALFGVDFIFGDFTVNTLLAVAIIAATAMIFAVLSYIRIGRKKH